MGKQISRRPNGATEERARSQNNAHEISPVVRERHERIQTLRLSRTRTISQLEHATRPQHRDMLNRTLRALEAEIEELN
jgi:hypothetical protein